MNDPLTSSFFFSLLGWKSKGLKSKGHFKNKGHSKSKSLKAFKGTKAKSYIHKGLAKRSAEPGLGWSWSRGFYWKGHFKAKGKPKVYYHTEGRLISKCPFDVFKSIKNQRFFFKISGL